jgi:HSP20 family protein
MPFAHWDPVRELLALQERMNRLIDSTLSRTRSDTELSPTGAWSPAVDLFEADEHLILKAELPEVEQADIELSIDDERVTLRGERHFKEAVSEKQFLRMERSYGRFHRTLDLPIAVDADAVKAEFKKGILTVFMPKRVSEKTRQIPISG